MEEKEIFKSDPVLKLIDSLSAESTEIQKAILFGSRARGDFKPESDYDIAFVADKESDLSPFFSKIIDLNPTLKRLDLVHYEKASNHLKTAIDREGKVVYETTKD